MGREKSVATWECERGLRSNKGANDCLYRTIDSNPTKKGGGAGKFAGCHLLIIAPL